MERLSGVWKPKVVFRLLDEPLRFSELARMLPGISNKVLADQLKALEKAGIVSSMCANSSHVTYAITETGRELRGALEALFDWGVAYKEVERSKGVDQRSEMRKFAFTRAHQI
ncbi:MAG: helix-turn-helix transcriptional regulator [Alphaproteobacteria bacterium GM202ARS2]|nr:helix-turn-helix transcriptional regulator [Alphaproteobacteria bacterium GM202ARS2]